MNPFFKKHILSAQDVSKEALSLLFNRASFMKRHLGYHSLQGKIIANCFFEPSTRTRLSFASSALSLGASVIGFDSGEASSMKKGESLQDTIRVVSEYADLLIVRQQKEGALHKAVPYSSKPLINAGDGSGEHPTQTFLDLFTIYERFETLEGLSIGLMGDLLHGRAIRSFILALLPYKPKLTVFTRGPLGIDEALTRSIQEKGLSISFENNVQDALKNLQVLYVGRAQKERFSSELASQKIETKILSASDLEGARDDFCVLHPLPRNEEIAPDVDATPWALYFEQAKNGLWVRKALLDLILSEKRFS